MVRPVHSVSTSPRSHFGCEVSSLVRCNAVWNTTTGDTALSKFTDGSFGRSIMYRKGKFITRISIPIRTKLCLFHEGRSNVVNLPTGYWLVTPGNGVILGAQCWFLLLTDWALSSSCSLVSLGEWKSILSSPFITSISATVATLFLDTPGKDRNGWKKRLTVHRTGHPINLIIRFFLSQSHL